MTVSVRALDSAELTALSIFASGTLVLGSYGVATRSPNTMPYVATVVALAALLARLRRRSLPPVITIGLACLAIAHLAGGVITVGDDVLYNAHAGHPAIEYDHFVHAAGVFLGTVALWICLVPAKTDPSDRRLVLLVVLAGLGLGAVNETIEFVLTVAHSGAHVGGYTNTGWDLVSNVTGAVGASAYLMRR